MENPLVFKGKTIRQTQNNLTIIKSIIIILVYGSWLKKNLSCFSLLNTHTHTLIISLKGGNTLLSPPWLSSWKRQPFTLSSLAIFLRWQYFTLSFLLCSSQAKIPCFTLYFPSPHREDPWAKAIKFFVVLSIYKTLLLFPFASWTRNTLPLQQWIYSLLD